jgi:hypothetical protein
MRYSLLSLFILLAFYGVSLGALAAASYLLAGIFFSLAISALCAAVVGVAVGKGSQRAFWLAFLVFGGVHFILTLGPKPLDDYTGELMPSRHFLDLLGKVMNQRVADHLTMPGIWTNLPYAASGQSKAYRYLTFVVIGQSAITVGLGWLSGIVASYLYCRGASRETLSQEAPVNGNRSQVS